MYKTEKPALALPESGKKEKWIAIAALACLGVIVFMMILNPAFAASDYTATITDIVQQIVNIVGTIFQVIGVILAIYAVGQLVLAFKNEDANSKSSASQLLVVAIILIAIPAIVDGLDLVSRIGS